MQRMANTYLIMTAQQLNFEKMKPKQIKLTQTGIEISGSSTISLWGGGTSQIEMKRTFIPFEKISKDNILRCVNDGEFGCESIESASIDIFITYGQGMKEFNRTIEIKSLPHYHKLYRTGI